MIESRVDMITVSESPTTMVKHILAQCDICRVWLRESGGGHRTSLEDAEMRMRESLIALGYMARNSEAMLCYMCRMRQGRR